MGSKRFWQRVGLCSVLLMGGCSRRADLISITNGSSGTAAAVTSGGASSGASTGGGNTSTGGSATAGGTTTGGPLVIGSACDPEVSDDPCESVGLRCWFEQLADGGYAQLADGGYLGACHLPGQFEPCTPGVGCVAGYGCSSQVFVGSYACVQLCTSSRDCFDSVLFCAFGILPGTVGGCVHNFCDTIFAACDVESSGDGTCYPFYDQGLCNQSGSVENNQPCSWGRVDGGNGDLCVRGSVCVGNDEILGGEGGPTACYAACDPFGGTPGCDASSMCIPLPVYDEFGICMEPCTTTCPTPLSCQSFADAGMLCAP